MCTTAIGSVVVRHATRIWERICLFLSTMVQWLLVWDFNHPKGCFEGMRSVLNQAIARVGWSSFGCSRTVELIAEIRQNLLFFACLQRIHLQTWGKIFIMKRKRRELWDPTSSQNLCTSKGSRGTELQRSGYLTIASACYNQKSMFWIQWGHPEESKT